MADTKLSALPAASALSSADLFYVVQGGASKKADGTQVSTLVFATSSPTLSGQVLTQGLTTTSPGFYSQITGDSVPRVRVGLNASDVASIAFGSGAATRDIFLERLGAASLRFGTADAAAPVAQTISVQNVVTGTSNTAGAALTVAGSRSTGNTAGGSIIFQTSQAGGSGTAQNALVTILTLSGDATKTVSVAGSLSVNGAALSGAALAVTGAITSSTTITATSALSCSGGSVTTSSAGGLIMGTRSTIFSSANGIMTVYNNAATDFTRLTFGGVTSAFPGIARSAATLVFTLGDGSANCNFAGGLFTSSSATLHATSVALTDGTAAALGTLANAPTAGNPTKWVPINDNGTTRYIPAW